MLIYEFSDYRKYLKAELADRMSRNSTYSMRAMAKSLGIASSTLSEVINGRTNLSVERAREIAKALKLKGKEINYLCDLVHLDSEPDPEIRQLLIGRMTVLYPRKREVTDLSLEQFKQMSEWHHSAILELALLKNFDFNAENISKSIGAPKPSVELAIDRLFQLGLLEKNAEGKIVRLNPEFKVRSEFKNSAMRKYYRQMLEKVSVSLDEQTPQERLSGYLNLPLDKAALPEIDECINRFFAEIKNISSKHQHKSEIYHLSLHFINLIKKGDSK